MSEKMRISVRDEGFNWCWRFNHAIDAELREKCNVFCFVGCPYYGYRRMIVIEERKEGLGER
jgi:hypothetical protein